MFKDVEIRSLDISLSNYLPLLLVLKKVFYVPKPKTFSFDNVWLKERECRQVVERSWTASAGFDLQHKIALCRFELMKWGAKLTQDFKQRLDVCRMKLKKLGSLRDTRGVIEFNTTKDEYHDTLE